MAEQVTLIAPVFVSAGASAFRVWVLTLRRSHPDRPAGILAIFREVDAGGAFIAGGKSIECTYEDAVAETLLAGLNVANLSVKSLERRVTERCQLDVKLGAGAISGTP